MAVHYEQVNNMLLNEFLKEHKKVEEQQRLGSRPSRSNRKGWKFSLRSSKSRQLKSRK